MAKPRVPIPKADVTGYSLRHPERFRTNNVSPLGEPLGDPPTWLNADGQAAWEDFADTLPWLNRSHRCHVGIAALLASKLRAGVATDSALNLLRLCLGQMGANPADFAKVGWVPPKADEDDGLGD